MQAFDRNPTTKRRMTRAIQSLAIAAQDMSFFRRNNASIGPTLGANAIFKDAVRGAFVKLANTSSGQYQSGLCLVDGGAVGDGYTDGTQIDGDGLKIKIAPSGGLAISKDGIYNTGAILVANDTSTYGETANDSDEFGATLDIGTLMNVEGRVLHAFAFGDFLQNALGGYTTMTVGLTDEAGGYFNSDVVVPSFNFGDGGDHYWAVEARITTVTAGSSGSMNVMMRAAAHKKLNSSDSAGAVGGGFWNTVLGAWQGEASYTAFGSHSVNLNSNFSLMCRYGGRQTHDLNLLNFYAYIMGPP